MKLIKLGFIIALASGVSALFIYLVGVSSSPNWTIQLTYQDIEALQSLQSNFQKCVSANGLGLQATNGNDYCKVTVNFPSDTEKNWIDPKTGKHEPLSYEFDLCEAVATWEQVRNSTTILTREFIEALPNGWEEYAWRRINKGILL
ncbi:transferase [Lithospermum erythrorhizon]|uniref:Transferase n=1 Tax=Lithospermum erythrorhizon TaxID=34254 RepID=A0AAV3P5C9_LITER